LFRFSVLASGSSGNALYVETDRLRMLVDAGISGRELDRRLRNVAGIQLKDIDVLLLTHEHSDHVRGLRQVLKHAHPRVFATEGTWAQVPREGDGPEPEWVSIRAGQRFEIGDLTVQAIPVSHDAEEPVMFRLEHSDGTFAVLTDLGYFSDAARHALLGCRCAVVETNHDIEMLRAGRYPWSLKRRILGDKGHLSNEDAAYGLAEVFTQRLEGPVDVYLAHLSEENNLPELAELTVKSVLMDARRDLLDAVRLRLTSRTEPTPLTALTDGEESGNIVQLRRAP
jgi:phosphoribosyl 1,2-cyclic phosphodiesterase